MDHIEVDLEKFLGSDEATKDLAKAYEGKVKIPALDYFERMKIRKQQNLKFDSEGKISSDVDLFDYMIKQAELVKKFNPEMRVTHKKSKKTVESFNELISDNRFDAIIGPIANMISNGPQLGER